MNVRALTRMRSARSREMACQELLNNLCLAEEREADAQASRGTAIGIAPPAKSTSNAHSPSYLRTQARLSSRVQALTEELAGERAITAASGSELKAKAKQELAELQDELERKRTKVYLLPCGPTCWLHTCK